MKNWMFIFFMSLGIMANAQHVISEGVAYEVKGKSVFKEGIDITHTLDKSKKDQIIKTHKNKLRADKRAEKARKKQEKARKKAAKDLKRKQKAQDRYLKATKRLEQNQAKYDRLKERGRISPKDDEKWLKKLDRFKTNVEKRRKKL
ncbi:hypothetical protein [Gelidibacter pelagius]|uniref:Uncharacterized protein n=1 Tax=Gelidibacter pelagius TaxID=2819985 RepID=A0ABS3SUG2_9FLAO|nr:hypothetical protein [Gelidibacter pelagius]MBO3099076.1 hypothetical protein [Gelidibacter pelagius]